MEVLASLVRDLHSQQPHHIVITGDLTHLGLPNEFEKARDWLCALGPSSRITVVPGNHDTYVPCSWDRTFLHWTTYMNADADSEDTIREHCTHTTFPTLRVRGPIALIGVSTARPSAPILAIGSLGSGQLRRLENILQQAGGRQLFRVVFMHHPPVPAIVTWRKRLTDGASFRSVVAQHGAELVLHGHAHRTSLAHLETSVGSLPVIGVPSASAYGRQEGEHAQYHIYWLTQTIEGWDVLLSVRGYFATEDRFVPQGETRLSVHRPLV